MGGGTPIYCNVLHAEPRPEIPRGDGGDNLYLLGERFQMDYVVIRVIEAIGDAGVAADIHRSRRFSKRKREVQRERQRLSRLADFLTSKWQRHYGEEKRIQTQEKAAIKRLIATRVTERMEPYIHFHYQPVERPTCPYVGFHSAALLRQVEQSGIEDGEVVNTEANK